MVFHELPSALASLLVEALSRQMFCLWFHTKFPFLSELLSLLLFTASLYEKKPQRLNERYIDFYAYIKQYNKTSFPAHGTPEKLAKGSVMFVIS
ncbi:hypothetical protein JJQ72_00240 [Paenibacillus sp. F411]|uniref:hypothetical protein n=1 Tax=Paenibacillus sp. F411 TaxID=2820239 RepID=UPI001AAEF4A2|nr:hypothetical protein [Paenibacillus sp. F411]MBO2942417.1 hypothetical protein [Paenibacillus sp. F411]